MKLSPLSIIAASTVVASAATIRGSRKLSPAEVPHASSVHKKRSSEQDITEEPEFEEEEQDGPRSPGLMQTRIIGGGVTDSNRFPYAVSISDDIGHFCGGSLIAPDMVLTAAHCQGGSYNAVIGRHNLNSNSGESIPMDQEFPHPEYNDKVTDADWMLVKLKSSTTQNIPFIKINYDGSKPSPGQEVTVMGWGDTTADDMTSELAERLMSVTVNAISNQECDDSEGSIGGWNENYHNQITENMLCAKDNGEDSCQGDSGGPLVILGNDPSQDVQVGVVSWGIGCASRDFPGVYARVSRVTDWIKTTVCQESSQPPADLCGGAAVTTDDSPSSGDDAPTTNDDDGNDDDGVSSPPPSPSSGDDSVTDDNSSDDVYFYHDDDGMGGTYAADDNDVPSDDDNGSDDHVSTDDNTATYDDDDDSVTPWPTWAPTTEPTEENISGTDDNAPDAPVVGISSFGSLGDENWVTILEEDFKESIAPFISGGADAKWLSEKKGRIGIIDLQDGNGDGSSAFSGPLDASYSKYQVIFDAYLLGMEDDKSFCFDVSSDGGSQWTETQCWRGLDLTTKVWHDGITVGFSAAPNAIDLRVRFRCVGSDNQDDVFIDKIAIQGSQ
jgi:trypsin